MIVKAIGIKLFESDNWGGWKPMKEGLSTTIRASKQAAGILEVKNASNSSNAGKR